MTNEPIIDVNVTLGRWPTRRMPCDEPERLVTKLLEHNVVSAWAGSYDGLFHDDITAVNNRLAELCHTANLPQHLLPFGSINPSADNWQTEFDRCATKHEMPGIRLHPNYHGYTLDHPNFAQLLKAAADSKLIVQLAVLMEDARMMHPLMRVPPVDIAPLPKILTAIPTLKFVLLGALTSATRMETLSKLFEVGQTYVEISMLEGAGGIEKLLATVPLDRIMFGSHAPSFYCESAALKLRESVLPPKHIAAITHENAQRLISSD
jgi:predicted TIM-barrel fold metal-dependent hydrolase